MVEITSNPMKIGKQLIVSLSIRFDRDTNLFHYFRIKDIKYVTT